VRETDGFVGCRAEAATTAGAAGAAIELDSIRGLHDSAPAEMRSSMQKDLAAGREPELAAIAGPILRLGRKNGFSTTSTQNLVDRITALLPTRGDPGLGERPFAWRPPTRVVSV
jgi:ketopantoate reductase